VAGRSDATLEVRRSMRGKRFRWHTLFSRLKIFGCAEGTDDGGDIALIGIDFGVEAAHVGGGDFSAKIGERGTKLRKFFESGIANDGNGIVRREIMTVVLERNEMERIDETVGGAAGDDINLMIEESAIKKAEVHDAGSSGEMEIVAIAPAAKTVGTLEKFVADADAPFGSYGREIGHGTEMETLGILAANDHGEGVFKAKRFGEREMEAIGVLLFDAIIDGGGSVTGKWRLIEDGGEGGAGVFDVEIEIAGEKSFVDEESATEIGFAVDVNAGARFDVLGEEFGEDDLLSEKLGADGEMRLGGTAAGGSEVKEVNEVKEVKESEESAAHVRPP
ncbi:MAG: hypothetical protein WA798_01225, partial [Candidatus Acidiferrum sp.]